MLLDWVFAPQCAACGVVVTTTGPLCGACAATLVEHEPAIETVLGLQVIAPWRFGGALAVAIRRFKLAGALHLARALAPLIAPVLGAAARAHADPSGAPALVVPVPLHWRRRVTRGFDHAFHLARHACAVAELPAPRGAIARTRWTPSQATLPRDARLANLDGAFAVRRRARALVADRTILVVDDVVTTGATIRAIASPLYAAGARAVIGVALARTDDATSARG